MTPRILIIAGSDSGGGAGIQADIKTVTTLSGFATTAITALTAQNTRGVQGIFEIDPKFIAEQMKSVLTDIGADVIKTGMLHSAEVIKTVAASLKKYAPNTPLIVDPVMVAKGGAALLQKEAIHALVTLLIPRALLITPNIPEAEILSGQTIRTVKDMETAGRKILELGARNVLMKGGHLEGVKLTDLLITPQKTYRFNSTRLNTTNTHGTGCTLASAIATFIGQKKSLPQAVRLARTYVRRAIKTGPNIGTGEHQPLNHALK